MTDEKHKIYILKYDNNIAENTNKLNSMLMTI